MKQEISTYLPAGIGTKNALVCYKKHPWDDDHDPIFYYAKEIKHLIDTRTGIEYFTIITDQDETATYNMMDWEVSALTWSPSLFEQDLPF